MPVKSDPSKGWTRRSAAVSVLLVLEEHRKAAGQRAVVLRERRGWGQEDLAHAAKLSVKTVSRFENGRVESRRGTLRAIVQALGVEEEAVTGPPPAPLGLGGTTQLDRIEIVVKENAERLNLVLNLLGEQALEEVAEGGRELEEIDPAEAEALAALAKARADKGRKRRAG